MSQCISEDFAMNFSYSLYGQVIFKIKSMLCRVNSKINSLNFKLFLCNIGKRINDILFISNKLLDFQVLLNSIQFPLIPLIYCRSFFEESSNNQN